VLLLASMVSPRIPRGKVYSESKLVDECDLGNFAEIFRSLAPCPARESVERGQNGVTTIMHSTGQSTASYLT